MAKRSATSFPGVSRFAGILIEREQGGSEAGSAIRRRAFEWRDVGTEEESANGG